MADGNLSPIGEAGFQTWPGLTVNNGDLAAGLGEIPRTRDAGQTGADDQNFHDESVKNPQWAWGARLYYAQASIINDGPAYSGR